MYDPPHGEGFFDFDADIEQAELEAAGRRAARGYARMRKLLALGRRDEAARACRHGGGYPLRSPAAQNARDPRAGEEGVRCYECGSVLSGWAYEGPVRILHARDWIREGRQP